MEVSEPAGSTLGQHYFLLILGEVSDHFAGICVCDHGTTGMRNTMSSADLP